MTRKTATLVLDDGSMFHGFSFGFDKAVAGEVVFNTAMTGYPEVPLLRFFLRSFRASQFSLTASGVLA